MYFVNQIKYSILIMCQSIFNLKKKHNNFPKKICLWDKSITPMGFNFNNVCVELSFPLLMGLNDMICFCKIYSLSRNYDKWHFQTRSRENNGSEQKRDLWINPMIKIQVHWIIKNIPKKKLLLISSQGWISEKNLQFQYRMCLKWIKQNIGGVGWWC